MSWSEGAEVMAVSYGTSIRAIYEEAQDAYVHDRLDEALGRYSRALQVALVLRNHIWMARIVGELADVTADLGDLEAAKRCQRLAMALSRITGERFSEAMALSSLAELEERTGNLSQAATDLMIAAELFESLGAEDEGKHALAEARRARRADWAAA